MGPHCASDLSSSTPPYANARNSLTQLKLVLQDSVYSSKICTAGSVFGERFSFLELVPTIVLTSLGRSIMRLINLCDGVERPISAASDKPIGGMPKALRYIECSFTVCLRMRDRR
jgi:hypothetical protein